jgi:hypothetical protein
MAQPATRNLGRLSEIAQVAVRHGFGYWFETHRLTDLFPRRGARVELDGQGSQRGQHLREMLDELGPTFVKFGQLLSTRPDVLPPDIIAELRGLQDDVRPFPFAQVEQVVEEDLGLTLDKLFLQFDEKAVAAASIGQVHRARPISRSSTRRRGSPRSACARSTSSTRDSSWTSSRARSATSSTTASRRATPTRSTATSRAIRTCASRASTGPTRAAAC